MIHMKYQAFFSLKNKFRMLPATNQHCTLRANRKNYSLIFFFSSNKKKIYKYDQVQAKKNKYLTQKRLGKKTLVSWNFMKAELLDLYL